MYVPKHFEESDVTVLHTLIESHRLGAWVTQGDGELIVNHIPFLLILSAVSTALSSATWREPTPYGSRSRRMSTQ